MNNLLSRDQVEFFNENGYLIVNSFYEESEIYPIWQGIYDIIGIVIEKYNLPISRLPFSPQNFDDGFQDIIGHDRKFGSEIYDAVKQIPAFVRLSCSLKHDLLFKQLRRTDLPGFALGGSGIRIDNPREEKFKAEWHQDYPAQFRSIDGLVFWSPLLKITKDLGPVEICPLSHKEGLVKVHTMDSSQPDKKGAYGLTFQNTTDVISRYEKIAPLLSPTDLLIIDFLLVHRSGQNISDRSRWSLQMRYFNFREQNGIKIGWAGSFAAGTDIKKVHPDLFVG